MLKHIFVLLLLIIPTIIFSQDLTNLKLTEIHYNPLKQDTTDGDSFEFIELKNIGIDSLDISLTTFTNGITYTFPGETIIEAGKFIVIASNSSAFNLRYGFPPFGEFSGNLRNSGERITLTSSLGSQIISVKYDDEVPWPISADGQGFSLVSKNPNPIEDPDNVEYWRASTTIHGSPMADDTKEGIVKVVVNEVLAHTDPPLVDAIEIYNPTNEDANIGGWYLTDNFANPTKWMIPQNTTVPAEGYIYFREGHYVDTNLVSDENEFGNGFSISSHGDNAYIYSADSEGSLSGYYHGFEFSESDNSVSWGRYITSEYEEHFVAQKELTLGDKNSAPLVGPIVINSINYHPDEYNYEYLEIVNISSFRINLYHPTEQQNTWEISGIDFKFPQGSSIESRESIFIVEPGVSEKDFRFKYQLDAAVQVFNYSGAIKNEGEKISVKEPKDSYVLNNELITPYLIIDEVEYNDKKPWPNDADSTGRAIIRIKPDEYGNDPVNWKSEDLVTGIGDSPSAVPGEFKLEQNYPNPFNPTTNIKYQLKDDGLVQLTVYDVLGQEVVKLVNRHQKVGVYEINFDASLLPSGVYFYRLQTGDFIDSKKLVLMK